jgi:hypothetical protein
VNLKTRLFAGVSTLAIAGGIAAIGASSATAAPTVVDHCTNTYSVAAIKNPVNGLGIVNTETAVKISTKPVNAPTCTGAPGALLTAAGPIDAGSFKTSIAGFASCDTSLLPPGLPPSGKFGFSQAGTTLKTGGYLRFASVDPTGSIYYSDVVGIHGMIIKGPYAGVDLDGTVFQNPTFKDKTVGATFGPFVGFDVNPFDSLVIGGSCLAGTSAGNLLFNDNHGDCTDPLSKNCVLAPTDIKLTLVGDGTSLLESVSGGALVTGAGGGNNPATGLTFSIF